MTSRNPRAVYAAIACLALAQPLSAQQFGGQVSWGDNYDLGIGLRGEFSLLNRMSTDGPVSRAFAIGSLDYFFPDAPEGVDLNYLEFNANLAFPVTESPLDPYVGGGLNWGRASLDDVSSSDFGLNVLGGVRFNLGGLSTLGEARLELGGGEQLVLTFGVLFGGLAPGGN